MKELIKNHAYPCCLVWLLCVGFITNLNALFKWNVNEFFLVIFALFCVALIRLFDRNKRKAVSYIILAIIIFTIASIMYLAEFPFATELTKYRVWLNQAFYHQNENKIWYSIFTLGIITLFLSMVIHILVKKLKIRIAIAILIIIGLVLCSFNHITVSQLGVCCLLTYIFLMIVEMKLVYFYEKVKKTEAKPMPFLLPFFFVFIIVTLILPMKQTPIEWKLVKECINKISDSIETLMSEIDLWKHPEKVDFSIAFMGYSENGDIGGTLEESSSEALQVNSTTHMGTNIYLTGNIKNDFDGTQWTNDLETPSYSEELKEHVYDISEILYAVYRTGTEFEPRTIYSMSNLNITYKDIYTRTLFYPLKTTFIVMDSRHDDYDDKKTNIRFDDSVGEGTSYRISYMNMNLGSKYFDAFVNEQGQYRYTKDNSLYLQSFLEYAQTDNVLQEYELQDNFEQLLQERASYIQKNYTHVYDGLPERVRNLAKEITKDCTTDYEKLLSLENYFASYTYTTIPKQPQEGDDLIDYMLFESKEGYCTYYATAFAVMARCLDIPTRYVQGFCGITKGKKSSYKYTVYNRDAHAWVEAYIEGIGWIPFEPTPTYRTQRYQPWEYNSNQSVPSQAAPTQPPINTEQQMLEQMRQQEELRNRQNAYRSIGVIFSVVFLVIFLSIPVYFGIRFRYLKKRYEKSSVEEKIFYDIEQLLYIFECCKRKRRTSETFASYMSEVRPIYPNQEQSLRKMEWVFHSLRYNDKKPDESEQQEIALLKQTIIQESKLLLSRNQYISLRWHLWSNNLK